MVGKTNIYFHEASKIEVKVSKLSLAEDSENFYEVVNIEVTSPDGEQQSIDCFGVRNVELETVGVVR